MNQFVERYKQLGETIDPEQKIKPSIRINTLKISEKELIKRLEKQNITLEKIPFLENAFWYQAEFSLASSTEYLLGYFYIQEAASQIPPKVLLENIDNYNTEDILILDMCAAPGSKTTQIAQLTDDKFPIIALDSNNARLTPLKNNIERLQLKSILTYKKDARYCDDLNKQFTHILLDAPCSGNYCVEKNFFSIRNLEGINTRSKLQQELLIAAYKSLKSGGTLVYSTCSLEPEEDELIINWFLEKYTDMKLEKINIDIGDQGITNVFDQEINLDIKLTKRFWPHKTETEGFFIAKLKKQ